MLAIEASASDDGSVSVVAVLTGQVVAARNQAVIVRPLSDVVPTRPGSPDRAACGALRETRGRVLGRRGVCTVQKGPQ